MLDNAIHRGVVSQINRVCGRLTPSGGELAGSQDSGAISTGVATLNRFWLMDESGLLAIIPPRPPTQGATHEL